MISCAHCGEQATDDIPAIPNRVCRAHAQEFWTGLLSYVKQQAAPTETPDTPCVCSVCNDMSMVKLRMIAAGAASGGAPEDAERAPNAAPRSEAAHARHGATYDAATRETPRGAANMARA